MKPACGGRPGSGPRILLLCVYNIYILKSKAVISESINFPACLRILSPQMREATRLRFCRFSAPVDVSNERSFPSSSPSIKRLLPHQSFTRRLISVKSMRLLVPALLASNADKPFGAAHVSAALPLPLLLFLPFFPFMFPFSSLPRCLRVFVFSPLSFKSRQVGANSLAVFPPFFSSSLSCFLCVAALSVFPCRAASTFLQIELRESLDQPFWRSEVGFGVFLPTNRELYGFGRLQISSTNTQIKIYTLYYATHPPKHIQQSDLAKFSRQFDGSVALLFAASVISGWLLISYLSCCLQRTVGGSSTHPVILGNVLFIYFFWQRFSDLCSSLKKLPWKD